MPYNQLMRDAELENLRVEILVALRLARRPLSSRQLPGWGSMPKYRRAALLAWMNMNGDIILVNGKYVLPEWNLVRSA